ncbi:MAG: ATP-binding protein [Candidatus Nanopelagicales bacterium]
MIVRRGRFAKAALAEPEPASSGTPTVPSELIRALAMLPGASLVVTVDSGVLHSSGHAQALGLTRHEQLVPASLRDLVRTVVADGKAREREIRVRRPPLGRGLLDLRVQVSALSEDMLLLLVTDLSDERRVDAMRRDFVANVSHELKTPVGALSLLSEAVLSAADDAESVRRFADRMQSESRRLAHLINDIIDLSRLESSDPLALRQEIDLADVVAQAVEELTTLAQARDIEIVAQIEAGSLVLGDRSQVLMAMRNLINNALAYSSAQTRVSVTVRRSTELIEVDVKDQGIGIPSHDLDRIFERFYRVDPARSRNTGGTGLGLAIVKHVCRIHGGECQVWSEVGVGSTFTLRLPRSGRDSTASVSEKAAELVHSEGE